MIEMSMTIPLRALTEAKVLEIVAAAEARAEAEERGIAEWARQNRPGDDPRFLVFDAVGLMEMPDFAAAERRRLRMLLADLTAPQVHELAALMWLGRGDDDDFDRLVRHAERISDAGDRAYLLGKLPLGEYLRCGLARLRARQEQRATA